MSKIDMILCAWRCHCKNHPEDKEELRQAILEMHDDESVDRVFRKLILGEGNDDVEEADDR